MLNFRKSNINHVDLSVWDLSRACLWGVCAIGTNFKGSQLVGADCRIGNFSKACFENANCRSVNFLGAYLNHADFSGANLSNVKFSSPSIFNAVFDARTCTDGATYCHLGEEEYWLNDLLEVKNSQGYGQNQFFFKIKNHYFQTA